tara:strand:+ start:1481 stop:2620 length:1140 start_codon:yes stop_codon:yes gene_type:complete
MKFSFAFCAFLSLTVAFLQGCSSTVYVASTDKPETIQKWAKQAFPRSVFVEEYFTFTTHSRSIYERTVHLDKSGHSFVFNERSYKEINDSFSQFCHLKNIGYSMHYGEIQDKRFLICAPIDWETPSKQDLQDYNIGFPFVMLQISFNYGRANYLSNVFVVSKSKALKLQSINQYEKIDNGQYAQGIINYTSNNKIYMDFISAFVSSNKVGKYDVGRQMNLVVKAYDEKGDYQYIPFRFLHLIERSDYGEKLISSKKMDTSSDLTFNIRYSDPLNTDNIKNLNASSIKIMQLKSSNSQAKRDLLIYPFAEFPALENSGDKNLDKVWYFSPLGEAGSVGYFNVASLLSLSLNWHDYPDPKLNALDIRKELSKKYVDLIRKL